MEIRRHSQRLPALFGAVFLLTFCSSALGKEESMTPASRTDPESVQPGINEKTEPSADLRYLNALFRTLDSEDPRVASAQIAELTDVYLGYKLSALPPTLIYDRYVAEHLVARAGLVRSAARSGIIISTGPLLRMMATDGFEGRAYAIDLTSFGLSTAAVRGTANGLAWIDDLKAAKKGSATGYLSKASRYRKANPVVWIGEDVIITYVTERISRRITAELNLQEAREIVEEAVFELLAAAESKGDVELALVAHASAWDDYREFLYARLRDHDVQLEECLESVSRQSRIINGQSEVYERLNEFPELKKYAEDRYGSVQAYASHQLADDLAEVDARADKCLTDYNANREKGLQEIFEGDRLDTQLIDGLEQGSLEREISRNRVQSYEDEIEVLKAASFQTRGHGLDASSLESGIAVVEEMKRRDTSLYVSFGIGATTDL